MSIGGRGGRGGALNQILTSFPGFRQIIQSGRTPLADLLRSLTISPLLCIQTWCAKSRLIALSVVTMFGHFCPCLLLVYDLT